MLLLTGELAFVLVALVDRLPQGPAQWAATAATGLAALAQIRLLARYGDKPGPDRAAACEPYVPPAPHPALVELSEKAPEAAARLRAGRLRTTRRRNRGRRRRRGRGTAAARMDDQGSDPQADRYSSSRWKNTSSGSSPPACRSMASAQPHDIDQPRRAHSHSANGPPGDRVKGSSTP